MPPLQKFSEQPRIKFLIDFVLDLVLVLIVNIALRLFGLGLKAIDEVFPSVPPEVFEGQVIHIPVWELMLLALHIVSILWVFSMATVTIIKAVRAGWESIQQADPAN